ncbi:tRNA synthetases class II-domain-containing protein [Trichophaea hybrida]|nr:tRNA synthetases class II-domain-containing protein [Trichophaea hybrida]
MHKPEIQLESLIQLNSVSPDLIYTPATVFPPEKRHLQLRTSPLLTDALRMRNKVSDICRQSLRKAGSWKLKLHCYSSQPRGSSRVPRPNSYQGNVLCLPQSPQQYKQILMASGVARYFQFAKCFRDEDLRADRQPEFTQLDLEMSFARKEDVIRIVHKLISDIFYKGLGVDLPYGFRRMTYLEAMHSYGTDKPDLRHGFLKIHKVHFDEADGSRDSIEAFHIRRKDTSPRSLETMKNVHDQFVAEFKGDEYRFRSYVAGESSAYGIPELGLTASIIETVNERLSIEEGDIVLLKRRRGGFIGGSTIMGRLRQALINKAVEAGVLAKPKTYEFVWITDFPLFTPVTSDEPGQSGIVGFASTHHPFTAPHEDDFELLATDPLKVRAEHYDIVVNGVELGGGSRRIHDPELQRYILEDVIKVHPDKLRQFDHLIDVLGSGCPPHAGIALGFDRLIAVLMGTDNIREVIAFPKNSNGADPLVGSPSLVTDEDLATYWLRKTRQ